MFEISKIASYLLAPLTWGLGLWIAAGACLLLRHRRWTFVLALSGFALLWMASTPVVALALAAPLEQKYPAITAAASPSADVILVLGGALSGASPPKRPTFNIGPSAGRVWFTAELYRARKAPWVVVAGGNQPGQEGEQVEAEAITEMLGVLGVPHQAIRIEGLSRNTRENAANSLPLVQSLGAKRVLLVTSAIHMPRAIKTFEKAWSGSGVQVIAATADVESESPRRLLPKMWIPDASALGFVTKLLKEYAGGLALDIM
ncbi:YdcF family protein [Ramlibacter sp. WS9]|uniref:YdcF family protein n=1 Tax=Ramlibacter sp. WS9 TaxID=1882741 RepID=UPI001142827C|nr:YdcF family protein [Ramlibacter sp. WS9]ROZ66349.1 YdcF family protein [Ramlibacter sp. WS9]